MFTFTNLKITVTAKVTFYFFFLLSVFFSLFEKALVES